MRKFEKVKLLVVALLFTSLFVMNGSMATKSEVGNLTLTQITQSNAGWSETYYPCGIDFVCVWLAAVGACSPFEGESVCYCYCY